MFVFRLLLMAIAFGRAAQAQQGASAPATPIAVTIVINAGETGAAVITFAAATPGAVTSITNGGTWTLRKALTNGTVREEAWSTPAGGALAATSVSIAYSGTNDAVEAQVEAWTGVAALGATASGSGSTSNPSIALVTQDSNNVVVGGIGLADGSVATSVPTAGTGNLRKADAVSAAGANDSASALTDNTAASPGSVTNSVTYTASAGTKWAAVALELRSIAGGVPYDLTHSPQYQSLIAQ